MQTIIFLTSMAAAISEFIDSNTVVAFLIAAGLIIMAGVLYGAKLWCDIRHLRQTLKEQMPEKETLPPCV